MPARVTVVTGPPRSGKTQRLLACYRRMLRRGVSESAIWLSPTWRSAAEVRPKLLEGSDGCFSPGVMTFEKFAEAVLEVAPVAIRPLSRLMKRQLVRRLIADQRTAGRLKHFAPIAPTSGLLDVVCEFISELKRLEIWPEEFHQACRARGVTDRDIELFEVYDTYQQCLREHHLYDAEGRFWSARALLRDGQRWPWERVCLVVADGFTDFTRTQHEILEILAGRVEELLITLPLEAEPRRDDLFTKPLATLAELRRRHSGVVVETLPRAGQTDWPAMAHVEKTLFANPRRARPAENTDGIEILAAARPAGEIETIGSRIKRLLSEGVARPGDIAVVFRSPRDAGSLVAEVFDALGIPFAIEVGEALDRAPALRALAALVRLDIEDWPFRSLLAVLGSNYFQPDWPEWRDGAVALAAERAVRRLQIPYGRQRLMDQLIKPRPVVAPNDDAPSRDGWRDHRSRLDGGVGDAESLVAALLNRLAATFDALPQRATLAGWAAAWRRLAADTGLLRVVEQQPLRSHAALPDSLAWTRLMTALTADDTLATWLKRHPSQLDRRDALTALLDILRTEQVGAVGDESGQVRVLSAASVRALRIPHLFVAGLSERAFPPPEREDRLYTEAEYQRLIDEGLPLVARTDRNREEMLLFYETLTRATQRLHLSYPAMDESAQPLLPSPFLGEVEQACGPGSIRRTELSDLSPIPTDGDPLCRQAFRVRALASAIDGDADLLAGLLRREPDTAENLLAGLNLTQLRQRHEGFSEAEGIFSGDAVRTKIAGRFNLERTFSATELEQYAACPYRFLLDRVLKLEPVDDLELAVDVLQRGRLVHDVLAAFHRRLNEQLGRPASPLELDAERFNLLMCETLQEQFERQPTGPVAAALGEVDRRVVTKWLAAYREQCEQYEAASRKSGVTLAPEFFEVAFGRSTGEEEPASTTQPLKFAAGGQTVRISGRIDRIDTGNVAGATVFNVLDYKTGAAPLLKLDSVEAGTTLQLPLYALAAAELLLADRHAIPWQLGYWAVSNKGFRPLKTHKRDGDSLVAEAGWEAMQSALAETVTALVCGMRHAEFPVCSADERCTGYCAFHTVCRINQVRSLEKTWRPTAQNVAP